MDLKTLLDMILKMYQIDTLIDMLSIVYMVHMILSVSKNISQAYKYAIWGDTKHILYDSQLKLLD